ncbi:GNAT family N-acetyltransferase [Lactobacillus gasseri]|nr:GNAT family N-acetyltransferase [Lactobacillus gasseri]MCZ3852241.1 GNAT family N-acetyltransferase [Lactobacillus gasseri]MCZ3860879.1 GNAT family N-acetyltransferase [Lactobacillus gasseri]MCZ3893472.1 GNAT family N-acetyltransferase [Lactobacillus gasseri]MCZ3895187.1 GNAT family N-acetyltransferase [Lactobacillus gasseri]
MKLNQDKETLDQIAPLVEYAFLKNNDIREDPNFLSRYNHSMSFGEYKDGHLASYIMVNKFKSMIFAKKVKMGGVGYVASYPENRGQGDINRLMKEIMLELHDQNYAISNLAPFSETFYRRYGYENAIYEKMYQIQPAYLRFFKAVQEGKVVRGRWSDSSLKNAVIKLYQAKLNQDDQRNTVVRAEWWWDRLDTYYPGRSICVYFDKKQQPQGYMFYRIVERNFRVEEMYYQTPQAAKALLSIIASHSSSDLKYYVKMPEESLLEEFFPEQEGITVKILPYMMTRIINIKQVLEASPLVNNKKLTIEVTNDDIIAENNGVWLIDNANEPRVREVETDPDYTASLTNWTKVLLGHLTLKQAVQLGFVKENHPVNTDFVKVDVSFYDYF